MPPPGPSATVAPAAFLGPPRGAADGGVPERSNGAVSKTVVRATVPWVRIPPPPPVSSLRIFSACNSIPPVGRRRRALRANYPNHCYPVRALFRAVFFLCRPVFSDITEPCEIGTVIPYLRKSKTYEDRRVAEFAMHPLGRRDLASDLLLRLTKLRKGDMRSSPDCVSPLPHSGPAGGAIICRL